MNVTKVFSILCFIDLEKFDLTKNDLLTATDFTANDLTDIMKVYMLICPTCSQWCEPYSELACIVSTLSMGFQLATPSNSGYEFAGNYKNKGYYGITGYGVSRPGLHN